MLGRNGNKEGNLEAEIESILRRQHGKELLIDQERDCSGRSGSAPPTVEGSLAALHSLLRSSNASDGRGRSGANGIVENSGVNVGLGKDEIRSHPAHLANYGSCKSVNPTLPQKLLSGEDWLRMQRIQVGNDAGSGSESVGLIGELRRNKLAEAKGSSSLSVPPGFLPLKDALRLRSVDRGNQSQCSSSELINIGSDGSTRMQPSGLGPRRKSFADIVQVGLDRPASQHMPRPASYNAFGDITEASIKASNGSELCNSVKSLEGLSSRTAAPGLFGSLGSPGSHAFASGRGSSLSRSTTPDIQLVGIPSCSGFPVVENGPVEKKVGVGATLQNGHSSSTTALDELAATLSGSMLTEMAKVDHDNAIQAKLLSYLENHPDLMCNMSELLNKSLQQSITNTSILNSLLCAAKYTDMVGQNGLLRNPNVLEAISAQEARLPRKSASSANLQSKVQSFFPGNLDQLQDQNASTSSIGFRGLPRSYSFNQKFNSARTNHLDAGISEAGKIWNSYAIKLGDDLPFPVMDSYLGRTSDYVAQAGANSCVSRSENHLGHPSGDMDPVQKAYIEVLLAQQRQLYELSLLGKSSGLDQCNLGNQSYGLDMKSLGNSLRKSFEPSGFQNEQVFPSNTSSSGGSPSGAWQFNVPKRKMSTLLDEFKTNKARSFELSDIVDHVVEFSMDQYGSRFIQQKLETAADSEKEKIFPEIIPQARTLMTDVFGNYVVQKFFEHGTPTQRAELVSQLTGHVLPLSLQMYGCRVIQKALELVDVDEQTRIVGELHVSVMKCVRDQNGNHVIQKCIECIPEDRIQFIISAFYGQILPLSTHPYGCRVIQRILEHCKDIHTHQVIMDEIMQSVCTLAQDQYGNYVIQHVLEHGKPHEKSAIIRKLAGQIVRMSQQKFASNVVEKCLTNGGPEERQLLVDEMLGSTDENEPLQVMMKDPFGNYVVQKVLETCSDQSRELILSRIKVHLNALKKFTYGKHIVSRVEKLIATGERRAETS